MDVPPFSVALSHCSVSKATTAFSLCGSEKCRMHLFRLSLILNGAQKKRRTPCGARRLSSLRTLRRRRCLRTSFYDITWPPLAESVEPVIKPASSEARNTTHRAISSGSPSRPAGISGRIFLQPGTAAYVVPLSVVLNLAMSEFNRSQARCRSSSIGPASWKIRASRLAVAA